MTVDLENFLKKLHEPKWLSTLRAKQLEAFTVVPEPTQRDEEWRYTSLKGFTFTVPAEFGVSIVAPKGLTAMAMPSAVEKHEALIKKFLYSSLEKPDKFSLFNGAVWTNGYFVHAPKDFDGKPVVIKYTADSTAVSHSMIIAEPGARVTVCEIFEGETPLHNGTLEIFAQENAEVDLITVQRFSNKTWDISYKKGVCFKDARINWTFALLGGKTTKLREDTSFRGSGASSQVKGIYFGTGDQHFSVVTNALHVTPNTSANIDTKGVLRDSASSLTRGLIRIEKVARGTSSHLKDKTLHLTSGVTSNAIPSLEIENNDVRASHGATTGKIDETQLFYMMTRGLDRKKAEKLIVEGFLGPVIDAIEVEEIRESVQESLRAKIGE